MKRVGNWVMDQICVEYIPQRFESVEDYTMQNPIFSKREILLQTKDYWNAHLIGKGFSKTDRIDFLQCVSIMMKKGAV